MLMEWYPPWGTKSHYLSGKLCLMWILKFHYDVHKSPPPDPIQSQMNPFQIVKPFLFITKFNIILPYKPRIVEHVFFLSESLTQTFFLLFLYLLCFCYIVADLILYLITLMMFGEEYKLWSCSLYDFISLCPSLSGPHSLLNPLFEKLLICLT